MKKLISSLLFVFMATSTFADEIYCRGGMELNLEDKTLTVKHLNIINQRVALFSSKHGNKTIYTATGNNVIFIGKPGTRFMGEDNSFVTDLTNKKSYSDECRF